MDEDAATNAATDAIEWLKTNLIDEYVDGLIDDLLTTDAADEQKYLGEAWQYSLNLSSPSITGPESIVDGSFALDLEIDGIGLKVKVTRQLGAYLKERDGSKCGFTKPDGEVTEPCKCEGGTTTIGEIPMLRAIFTIEFTFLALGFKATGSDEKTGDPVIVEISG